jgi:hypothetical protein
LTRRQQRGTLLFDKEGVGDDKIDNNKDSDDINGIKIQLEELQRTVHEMSKRLEELESLKINTR